MATWTYEIINPTPIANTIVEKAYADGVHRTYRIGPVDGYILHDKNRDWTEIDPDTMEEVPVLGYTRGTTTCAANYDFAANPRELYAVPEDSVPGDQIFGGENNNHEVM